MPAERENHATDDPLAALRAELADAKETLSDVKEKVSHYEQRYERHFALINNSFKLVVTTFIIGAALATFMIGKTTTEMRTYIEGGADQYVADRVKVKVEELQDLQEFAANLNNRKAELEHTYKSIIGKYENLAADRVAANKILNAAGAEIHGEEIPESVREDLRSGAAFIEKEGAAAVPVDGDTLFNASTVAAAANDEFTALIFAKAAYEKEANVTNRSLMLRFLHVFSASPEEKMQRTEEILAILRTLPDSPEHIIGAAWNVTERDRSFSRLIAVMDEVIANPPPGRYIPSYFFAVKASAHLRRGYPNDIAPARLAFGEAKRRAAQESPKSTWFPPTLRQLKTLENDFADYDAIPILIGAD